MDIYCKHCGEPWDNDSLHDIEHCTGEDMPYLQAAARFRELGCKAFKPNMGRLRERAGLPSKPKHCTKAPILPDEMLRYVADSQNMSDYPDEWHSPEDIEFMLEVAEEMFT